MSIYTDPRTWTNQDWIAAEQADFDRDWAYYETEQAHLEELHQPTEDIAHWPTCQEVAA